LVRLCAVSLHADLAERRLTEKKKTAKDAADSWLAVGALQSLARTASPLEHCRQWLVPQPSGSALDRVHLASLLPHNIPLVAVAGQQHAGIIVSERQGAEVPA
jgi:hypothetical protein